MDKRNEKPGARTMTCVLLAASTCLCRAGPQPGPQPRAFAASPTDRIVLTIPPRWMVSEEVASAAGVSFELRPAGKVDAIVGVIAMTREHDKFSERLGGGDLMTLVSNLSVKTAREAGVTPAPTVNPLGVGCNGYYFSFTDPPPGSVPGRDIYYDGPLSYETWGIAESGRIRYHFDVHAAAPEAPGQATALLMLCGARAEVTR